MPSACLRYAYINILGRSMLKLRDLVGLLYTLGIFPVLAGISRYAPDYYALRRPHLKDHYEENDKTIEVKLWKDDIESQV